MNEPEHQSARMQGLDAAAHEAFVRFDESRKPIWEGYKEPSQDLQIIAIPPFT